MDVKDKVVIVTGASQGIGLAASRLLSKLGAKVVLAARSEDLLKKLEQEIPNSFAIVTDIRKTSDIKNLVDKTVEKFGRIDILVNNAGQGTYGNVENINIEHFKEIMELNVFGALEMMQAVVPIMKNQKEGVIVNISSGLTKMYVPGVAAYSSTKYALSAISFIARKELAKDNIVVSVVTPTLTETNFGKNSAGEKPNFSFSKKDVPNIDSPEKVADKIIEAIKTGQEEIVL